MLVELTINKIIYGGFGIGEYQGIKVFVPYTAPDDKLLVKITERHKNYYKGKVEKILEPSSLRTEPKCRYFAKCGGCDLQHLEYSSQLVVKKLLVNESLQKIGKIFIPVKNPEKSPKIWHYRNKSQYPLSGNPLRVGFFQRASHRVIDISSCLLHSESFDKIRQELKMRLISAKEKIYDEILHKGNLRHIIIRGDEKTGEILLIFVTRERIINRKVYQGLEQDFPIIAGIVQNYNPEKTDRILGSQFKTLRGRDFYYQNILDKKFRVSAGSFFQVNNEQTENLLKKILKFIEPSGDEEVLDLFCGVGAISLIVAGFVKRVIGVDSEISAIADAQENLRLNNIKNIEFIQDTSEKAIKKISKADIIILDPPRKGCEKELIPEIIRLSPKKILYISCNPTTLARDLSLFDQSGYETVEVQPIDMFPQTYHIETIALLVPKL